VTIVVLRVGLIAGEAVVLIRCGCSPRVDAQLAAAAGYIRERRSAPAGTARAVPGIAS
jgi:hypothetical protein